MCSIFSFEVQVFFCDGFGAAYSSVLDCAILLRVVRGDSLAIIRPEKVD
jgi:hypothetical protein